MMNGNSHFGTSRYSLIMYTIWFTYVAFGASRHYLISGQVGDLCWSLEYSMMNANSHSGILRYSLIMYTIWFTHVAFGASWHYLI